MKTFFAILLLTIYIQISNAQTAEPPEGSGTQNNPYLISSLENFLWLSENSSEWNKHFLQTNDIDLNDYYDLGGKPIGNTIKRFTGVFDGGGFILSDLDMYNTNISHVGLFGIIYGAKLKNIKLIYGFVKGINYVGGLVGKSESNNQLGIFSNIINCYYHGDVEGQNFVGGLIGENAYNNIIKYSKSEAYIDGNEYVGGFVGSNYGKILISESTSQVYGTESTGGFVGYNFPYSLIEQCSYVSNRDGIFGVGVTVDGAITFSAGGFAGGNEGVIGNSYAYTKLTVESDPFWTEAGGFVGSSYGYTYNCYSDVIINIFPSINEWSGAFAGGESISVANSFWNSESTEITQSKGGTPLTTQQLKTLSYFLNAGWDFVNENTNGTDDIWKMESGDFPRLKNDYDNVSVVFVNNNSIPTIIENHKIGIIAENNNTSLFVEYFDMPAPNLPEGSVSIGKYWNISEISGNIKLRLFFHPSLISSFSGLPKIYHYTSGNWVELNTSAVVEEIPGELYYVETTSYHSSFSPVTIGDNASPLPVELTAFTAKLIDNSVILNWQTSTEINNYGFDVERKEQSSPSMMWESIGFVNGHGNSNSVKNYSYIDDNNLNNGKYYYRLKQIDTDGKFEYSNEIEVDFNSLPSQFSLEQNYPNPFNPSTTISYSIAVECRVTLKIFDILGNEVAVLVNENQKAGTYTILFDASNFGGLSSGVYFYTIFAGTYTATKKLTLIK